MLQTDRSPQRGTSYHLARERFDTAAVATSYPAEFRATRRDRREVQCILSGLCDVPHGASVVDFPCGAGRLTWVLARQGFRVTAADSSPKMISRAESLWHTTCREGELAPGDVRFAVRDVLDSGFTDGRFDAVVCNRLFHHFVEAQTRIAALRELGRISRGPVVVSFFNTFAIDSLRRRLRYALRGRRPKDRIAIGLSRFVAEACAAGLQVQETLAVRRGISPQWYAVLRRRSQGT